MTDTPPRDDQAHTDLRTLTTAYVNAVQARLREIPDPIAREYAARLVQEELLPDVVKQTKPVRAEAVSILKEGRTLKEVGSLTGLSIARVDQLLKGK
ncbi:hypothetical protein [Streptomyces sp. SID8352]|uniref:hypothetical protein n=1 Tax=Streptomyces sp. SID8352 TaxID=2690338 RepID=UPI00136FE997|nr:hypothetical protein [Streptomyces sp. SID8352]MYU24744.1 hypothetical protein [Streptomyces sp. SID8352]